MRSCLAYMGENYGYEYIMGTSGAAFRLLWKPGWHPDNIDILVMAEDTFEPFRQAFRAVGYAHEVFGNRGAPDKAELFRRYESYDYFRSCIIESIRDKRRPVIGFGVIGPPECCIITGYDEYGEALIGWNYFQDQKEFNAGVEFEPSGYFRKRNWFKDTLGLIIIGEKLGKPTLDEIHRKALEWALEVVRTPMVRGRHSGLAAYTAWAETLCHEDFPADGNVLMEHLTAHLDGLTMVQERWSAALFLMRIAEHSPAMASDLLAAASYYAAEHHLMGQCYKLASYENMKELAEPDVRHQIASLILQARDRDALAADHIERALTK